MSIPHYKSKNIYNIGVQMNRKELTKTFMVISNWKNPLVSKVCMNVFQRFKGYVEERTKSR